MQDAMLHVYIDKGSSADEVSAVEEAFHRAGMEAKVEPGILEFSQQFTWIIMISVPPTAFLSAYFAAAGADAWGAAKHQFGRLRRLVRDLKIARGSGQGGRIELEESGRAWLLLTSDLSDDAFRQLEGVDWSLAQRGSLRWDVQRQCWMHCEQGKEPQPVTNPQH